MKNEASRDRQRSTFGARWRYVPVIRIAERCFFFSSLFTRITCSREFRASSEVYFSVESIAFATLGGEKASETHRRHGEKKYKFHLSSFFIFSCFSSSSPCVIPEYECDSQAATADYYVRMRDLRSCSRIVCILLVARNRFMICCVKTVEMKTSNTITGEG